MATQVEQLVAVAGQLANAGRWDEAERAWLEVRKLEPRHPKALFSLGVHALKRGDVSGAFDLLWAARAEAPRDLLVLMTLAAACRQRGEGPAEREAIESALAIDAYFLPAMLAKASWLERFGSADSAATTFARLLHHAITGPKGCAPSSYTPRKSWTGALRN
jgi:aspartate beta-hydroxylase